MKFLCDRCKTRYSIGDDRVRGKILKIRCKNCANVITVREGMPEVADAAPAPAEARRQRNTTQAPMPLATTGDQAPQRGGNALGAAFASAMTKPPPALEEEWYVSIDGEQAGPFSLSEAQRWVASKAFDADLHCWSEGFDDWLPVDKVSHFRGLRKKPAAPPAPAAPPPLPRVGSGPARANTMSARGEATVEEEPKPLFAATMASLEKAAGLSGPSSAGPQAGPMPTPRVPLEPSRPVAKANGPAVSQRPSATPPTGQPALKNGSHALASSAATVPSKAFGFDASEAAAESATQIEAQPFDEETNTAAEPVASTARRLAGLPTQPTEPAPKLPSSTAAPTTPMRPVERAFDAPQTTPAFEPAKPRTEPKPEPVKPEPEPVRPMFGSQPLVAKHPFVDSGEQPTLRAPAPPPPATPAAKPDATIEDDEPDGLDIGEVSRVVKLADLMRAQPSQKAAQKRTGAVPLIATNTSVNTALGRTGSVPKLPMPLSEAVDAPVNPVAAPPVDTLPNDPAAHAVVATHRRGLIMLLIGAAVLIGVAVVVVVMMINKSRTTIVENLGSNFEFDGQRPDQLVFRDPKDPNPTPGNDTQGSAKKPPYTPWKNPNPNPNTSKPVDPPPGNSLKPEEVEEMAAKNSGTTQMCWRRSQRGADGILLADVKKMTVTLTVNADGGVADVQLSDNHAQNNLGKCLMGAIRSWKFRPSAGGTFRFILHFG